MHKIIIGIMCLFVIGFAVFATTYVVRTRTIVIPEYRKQCTTAGGNYVEAVKLPNSIRLSCWNTTTGKRIFFGYPNHGEIN